MKIVPITYDSPKKLVLGSPKKDLNTLSPKKKIVSDLIGKFVNDISIGVGVTEKLRVDQARIAEMVKDLLKECELLISDNDQLRDHNDNLKEKQDILKETYIEVFDTLVNAIIENNAELHLFLQKSMHLGKDQFEKIQQLINKNINVIEKGNFNINIYR